MNTKDNQLNEVTQTNQAQSELARNTPFASSELHSNVVHFPKIPKPTLTAKQLAKRFLDAFYVNPQGELAEWLDIPFVTTNDKALMMFIQQKLDTDELNEDSKPDDIMNYVRQHIPAIHLLGYMCSDVYWGEGWDGTIIHPGDSGY